jgi:hypothetical protein
VPSWFMFRCRRMYPAVLTKCIYVDISLYRPWLTAIWQYWSIIWPVICIVICTESDDVIVPGILTKLYTIYILTLFSLIRYTYYIPPKLKVSVCSIILILICVLLLIGFISIRHVLSLVCHGKVCSPTIQILHWITYYKYFYLWLK